MPRTPVSTRRSFLARAAAASAAAPLVMNARAFGANDQITMGCVGMGGQGRGDMGGFLGFKDLRVLAVCDVIEAHRNAAKSTVDTRYGNADCKAVNDYRDVMDRPDIDTVLIATPDHWHALIGAAAVQSGKDVYSEKPETLTVREGRLLVNLTRRYGRVYSGGSQRVWGDYNWFHRMIWGGAIGEVKEAWVDCWGPSTDCYLPEEPIPPGVDWDMWLGPAPWAPFNRGRLNFRPWRDYSGGGMTDWGAHNFGGALFAMRLHETGPVEILPPDGKENPLLTFVFANGVRMHHKGGWTGNLCFRGTLGEIPARGDKGPKAQPPSVHIPNYKGQGGIFGDFLHCVRTRQRPFRDIETAHRTVTVCHLGNIAYWVGRPFKWDPEKEEVVGDPEVARWLDRPKRAPWTL
ncbi:MAG TPA: Gfo/Idh/MocA family oxidoreductase [Planctomycetota bacterium]|nr:Gfo/Idh/MocA family oxidoreductase [Planctomycetota bacterium]